MTLVETYGDPATENMLIHGDNLPALQALGRDYAGNIKCIYIDPPYNTGSSFEHYEDDIEHNVWLDQMATRLPLLRGLLSPDGVIFVHIDDKEMAYLRVMMDGVFGRANFLNTIVVKTSDPSGHKVVNPSPYAQTEYILMYAKDRRSYAWFTQYVPTGNDIMYNKIVANIEEDYSNWRVESLAGHYARLLGYSDIRSAKAARGKLDFEADTWAFAVRNAHRVCQLTAISNLAGKAIVALREASKNAPGVLRLARPPLDDVYVLGGRQMYFLNAKIKTIDNAEVVARPLTNLWTDIPFNGISYEGDVIFKNGKKPEKLLRRCIEMSTAPGDRVLDCYLGSGTTAAVAHKLGRRWIGIESGEHLLTHCLPRLRRVVDGTDESGVTKVTAWRGGGGFRVYKTEGSPA